MQQEPDQNQPTETDQDPSREQLRGEGLPDGARPDEATGEGLQGQLPGSSQALDGHAEQEEAQARAEAPPGSEGALSALKANARSPDGIRWEP